MTVLELAATEAQRHFQVLSNDRRRLEGFVSCHADAGPRVPVYYCWVCKAESCEHCAFVQDQVRRLAALPSLVNADEHLFNELRKASLAAATAERRGVHMRKTASTTMMRTARERETRAVRAYLGFAPPRAALVKRLNMGASSFVETEPGIWERRTPD